MTNNTNKIRVIIYGILLLICCYFAVGYCYEIGGQNIPYIETTNNDIYIDGSDFTPIMNVLAYGVNGILGFITVGIHIIVISVVGLILLSVFCIIALRKTSVISQQEYRLYRYLEMIKLILAFFTGCFVTHFHDVMLSLIYNVIWFGESILIVNTIAKKRTSKNE